MPTEQADDGKVEAENKQTPQAEAPVTFKSQAELDAVIQSRVSRSKEATTSSILADLGIDSLDAVKAQLQAAADLKAAQMSEEEKRDQRIKELELAVEAANKEKAAALATVETQRKKTAVSNAASKAAFADPSDAWRFIDMESLKDDAAIEEAIKTLAEQKPYLLKAEPNQPKGSPTHKKRVQPQLNGSTAGHKPSRRVVKF